MFLDSLSLGYSIAIHQIFNSRLEEFQPRVKVKSNSHRKTLVKPNQGKVNSGSSKILIIDQRFLIQA